MEAITHPGKNLTRPALLLPVLLAALVYLSTAGGRAVIDYDEGYYAQAAKHMFESGDWVTPYANGVRFLEKPPLMYWATALSFKVFGLNEFALRLPTALAVTALVWVVIRIARRACGNRAAVIAGLCTAFSTGTYLFTRETLHDIWLVLFITVAMYAFLEWYLDQRRSWGWALLFYAALAGAVLCKSLIGVAFPVGIVVVFFLVAREWPKWRTLHVLPGSLLFLALAVPWHWLAAIRNQGFLYFFFISEQFLRFFHKREPPVLWSLPLLTFYALILLWFFPWTAFLPAALRPDGERTDDSGRTLRRLALVWLVVMLGFYAVSERLEHYAFPLLPALALLVGTTLSRTDDNKSVRWGFRGLALLGLLIAVAGAGAGIWFFAAGHGFAAAGSSRTGMIYQTDFSILADMPPSIQVRLLAPATITMLVLVLGPCAALIFEKHRRRLHAVGCLAVAMVVICGMIHWSLVICEDMISSKKFGLALASNSRPGDRLVLWGDYESANSLNFYEPLRVEVVNGLAYALVPGRQFKDAPGIMLTEPEFTEAWQSDSRVFALVPKSQISDLRPSGVTVLEVQDRVLLRNR